jgi:hypothetical protein
MRGATWPIGWPGLEGSGAAARRPAGFPKQHRKRACAGALADDEVGQMAVAGKGSVGRPGGADFKPGNRKGLRSWCLRVNRLQTKTETPFRFRRRSCARSTLQNAQVRAPAVGPVATLCRVFGSGAFSIALSASGVARRDMSGGGRSPPRRAVEQGRRWRKGFEDTVPGSCPGFPALLSGVYLPGPAAAGIEYGSTDPNSLMGAGRLPI